MIISGFLENQINTTIDKNILSINPMTMLCYLDLRVPISIHYSYTMRKR